VESPHDGMSLPRGCSTWRWPASPLVKYQPETVGGHGGRCCNGNISRDPSYTASTVDTGGQSKRSEPWQ